jgi:hypothetical protein
MDILRILSSMTSLNGPKKEKVAAILASLSQKMKVETGLSPQPSLNGNSQTKPKQESMLEEPLNK